MVGEGARRHSSLKRYLEGLMRGTKGSGGMF